MKLAGVFAHGYLFFLHSLYACGGVRFPSQAPALMLCFVRPSSEQLALAPAHVGNASPFIPMSVQKEFPLLFKNGILKLAGEKEPLPRPKKWPLANIMAPGALSIPNSFIVGGPYEDEDGELNKREVRKD